MDIRVYPGRLSGTIPAVESKSYAQRLIIASALADKETEISISVLSDDVKASLNAVKSIGAGCAVHDGSVTVTPSAGGISEVIDCAESGTAARLILPVAAAKLGRFTLAGAGSLLNRPFKNLCDALRCNGCEIDRDTLPLKIDGKLCGGKFMIPGSVSSQYVSGLLFALPILNEDSEIILTDALQSSGYVDMTINVLNLFGIEINKTKTGYLVKGNQRYISPGKALVEGDWSNSAYFLAAGVNVTGLNKDSLQKDKIITEIIDNIDIIKKVDVSEIPDLVPIISVIFALSKGTRKIVNAYRLRFKESDRMESTVDMINSLGGRAHKKADGLEVCGTGLSGGRVSSHNDHRIVMAASVAALYAKGETVIENAQAVNKSYPGFFSDFQKLGGRADVI